MNIIYIDKNYEKIKNSWREKKKYYLKFIFIKINFIGKKLLHI